jgi:Helicase conserved C-terminal domain
MNIIRLPAVLSDQPDLASINQQLCDGDSQLDWSAVVSASDATLTVLLKGLDLSNDAETLGLGGDGAIADHIVADISRFFQNQPLYKPKPSRQKKQRNSVLEAKQSPKVWQPSSLPKTGIFPDEAEVLAAERVDESETDFEVPPRETILKIPTAYEIRAELEEAILKELLGPAGGETEEIDEDSVQDRYLVGLLAPLHRHSTAPGEQPEEQDELAIADKGNLEEGSTEGSPAPAPSMFPSSLGMSFCVSHEAKTLEVTATWGGYHREASEIITKEDGSAPLIWKREPMGGTITIPLNDKPFRQLVMGEKGPDVYVQGQSRQQDGHWLVTIFLVNEQREPPRRRDEAWLFQPEISVCAPNGRPIFIRKALPTTSQNLDPMIQEEARRMAMLYRNQIEFAVGHGVSVHAELASGQRDRAIRLCTSVAPTYEVPKTAPPTAEEIPELAELVLDMKELAEASDLSAKLNAVTTAYASWISEQEQRITDPQVGLADFQDTAQDVIQNCRRALERIQEGLTLLNTDPQAAEAFRFMNRAMWQQRIHSLYAEQKRQGKETTLEEIDRHENRRWYPFQLAFILLNLPSLTDVHHPERIHPTEALADLLWFPTGGGKTEAYLGLTAYTIGLRRLQGMIAGRSGEYGVAVLMRYTLRLLTLQQFQRATALICACEAIRREDETKWGKEPFRIGLWVGERSTPNYTAQSEEFVKQARGQYQQHRGGSPHQLTNCPWCGTRLEAGKDIQVESFEKGRGRTLIRCGDPLGCCLFSKGEGLPVIVVDEEIYRRLPTLLIATVDKFAQMPWKGEVQMLFGQVNGYCERHGFRSPDLKDTDTHKKTATLPSAKTISHPLLRPPDLIIQDELHLISGPLGTLVGLYETAVDQLSSWEVDGKRVRPKVVASTATIRQASSQVYSLFLRKVQIFPPQGLEVEDNFFSRQRQPSEQTPGRRYLGICAPGRRLKAALIRVYVASLAASQYLYETKGYGLHADPWMTLVGYFNSLRELGGTRRLVDDDIRSRLAKMDRRGLARRVGLQMNELTSRKDSTEIPEILDWMETSFDPQQEAENRTRRKTRQKVEKRDPLDVILATNMISVGVDVKRLGLMVACGQPKNTAEYIQATSRVGRTYPGLVITVYNWARPRDLSHYERFEHYHATFYQHVEALSVTPFAPGALYRGLSALLVSMVRLSGQDFNSNDQAGRIESNHPSVQAAINAIAQRAGLVGDSKVENYVRQELRSKLDYWLDEAHNPKWGGTLKYKVSSRDGTSIDLLAPAGKGDWQEFTCLNSLRNVEPTIGLILTEQLPDEDYSRLPQPMTQEVPEV